MVSTINIPPRLTLDSPLTPAELELLELAIKALENPGFAARLTDVLGAPIAGGFKLLPMGWSRGVQSASERALSFAFGCALKTMGEEKRPSSNVTHKVAVGLSGGVGGVFGFAALPVELPFSTLMMMRSIADIARSEGMDIRLAETKLDCLQVFALGGKVEGIDHRQSAYWAVRFGLCQLLREAASSVSGKALSREAASVTSRLVGSIAARFGAVVSEEVAAKMVPVVGALSGAAINVLFIDHFQNIARAHFLVRRLETKYGLEVVQAAYQWLMDLKATVSNLNSKPK